ncbi:hypothetical protein, unlikely [Trypanosoma brucei gambiense DAL972]|uniref:Uncharacterized protein n=1 Tax=Trypanosoma brucei gambiense (strain MHOM/CI/86/DAL972) TaxID=679716 RepID=D0AAJ7_TRYB9|nr:hypothetical protein, unlikely [Trypanosoma brucei gambiense DAL972]CBH18698.1 hypothetical protein, unlikely [Trypanosoma brucei gambiense DAL972]|eukprot:XP_011780962.1 hypothetical protein, unlikely [Trypanosoma brucei gambiense DAL972]
MIIFWHFATHLLFYSAYRRKQYLHWRMFLALQIHLSTVICLLFFLCIYDSSLCMHYFLFHLIGGGGGTHHLVLIEEEMFMCISRPPPKKKKACVAYLQCFNFIYRIGSRPVMIGVATEAKWG